MDESNLDRVTVAREDAAAGTGTKRTITEAAATRSVPVLHRALSVLESIAASRRGLTLPEVCRKLQIPKSSAHCILLTLLREGYLTRSPRTQRYMFGSKLFSIANQALEGLRVREIAMPQLRQLMLTTGLTVHMGILERGEAVLIAKVDSPDVNRLATWIGRRMDVHCTGIGKALIAYLPPEELEELLRERSLPRHNENTIISAKRLIKELESVRNLGFATDDEEDEIGYRCVGVPILDGENRVVAAISVAGSTSQVTSENMNDLVRHLMRTANAIKTALGEKDES